MIITNLLNCWNIFAVVIILIFDTSNFIITKNSVIDRKYYLVFCCALHFVISGTFEVVTNFKACLKIRFLGLCCLEFCIKLGYLQPTQTRIELALDCFVLYQVDFHFFYCRSGWFLFRSMVILGRVHPNFKRMTKILVYVP